MFRRRLPFLALLCVLGLPAWSWAGIYNPAEADEGPFLLDYFNPQTHKGFQILLMKYRSCPIDQASMDKLVRDSRSSENRIVDTPFRQRYQLLQDLSAGDLDRLSLQQKLSVSEYLIRRRDPEKAWLLLRTPANRPGDNFLPLCNIATACQQLAEREASPKKAAQFFQQAIDYQNDALGLWPKDYDNLSEGQQILLENMGWSREDTYPRCRTAEQYFLKLLRSRFRLVQAGSDLTAIDAVDPLFVDNDGKPVRYVNANGVFEPGKLAAAELAKLPDGKVESALAIVQQLLVWLPHDARLYWQLGDLYNARGGPSDLRAAAAIFADLDKNFLDKSRKADKDPVKERCRAFEGFTFPEETGNVLPPGLVQKFDNPETDEASGKPIDWRTIGVSFGFGMVVALFGRWQIEEIRRRRSRAL